jgi:hypothetical protein
MPLLLQNGARLLRRPFGSCPDESQNHNCHKNIAVLAVDSTEIRFKFSGLVLAENADVLPQQHTLLRMHRDSNVAGSYTVGDQREPL